MDRREYFVGNSKHSYSIIAENGTYFFPAWKHYGRTANVVCDRCYKSNLSACIGYGEQDLCLTCADQMTCSVNISTSVTRTCGCVSRDDRSISDVCNEVRIIRK